MRALLISLSAAILAACAATPQEAATGNASSASSTTATSADIYAGTHWKLVEADGGGALQEHAAASGVTLVFAEGRAGGRDGCNSYSGPYSVKDDRLHIGPAAVTRMYCDGVASDVEAEYLAWLQQPLERLIDTADLRLRGTDDGRTLVFVADAITAPEQ